MFLDPTPYFACARAFSDLAWSGTRMASAATLAAMGGAVDRAAMGASASSEIAAPAGRTVGGALEDRPRRSVEAAGATDVLPNPFEMLFWPVAGGFHGTTSPVSHFPVPAILHADRRAGSAAMRTGRDDASGNVTRRGESKPADAVTSDRDRLPHGDLMRLAFMWPMMMASGLSRGAAAMAEPADPVPRATATPDAGASPVPAFHVNSLLDFWRAPLAVFAMPPALPMLPFGGSSLPFAGPMGAFAAAQALPGWWADQAARLGLPRNPMLPWWFNAMHLASEKMPSAAGGAGASSDRLECFVNYRPPTKGMGFMPSRGLLMVAFALPAALEGWLGHLPPFSLSA